ncbi:MAG TPA: DNA polymerase III subunit beta [Acidobacteriota bacterium]
MKFTVAKQEFLRELQLVQGVVERKTTVPILSNLLLEAEPDWLRLTATDLEVSLRTSCPAVVSKPGVVTLSARRLFDVVRNLPDAELRCEMIEPNVVALHCERAHYRILGLASDEFPQLAHSESKGVDLGTGMLREMIDKAWFAITEDDSRYSLHGAKLELGGKKVRMVATDAHRLALVERPVKTDLVASAIVPRKALGLIRTLAAAEEGEANLAFERNHLFYRHGERLMVARLAEGDFPNYERVLPKGCDKVVVVSRELLLAALRRVVVLASERTKMVKFRLGENLLTVESESAEVGEAKDSVDTDYSGPEMEIAFNAQYLVDFLQAVQGGEVRMELKDGESQALLLPASEDEAGYKYVVMPMRI